MRESKINVSKNPVRPIVTIRKNESFFLKKTGRRRPPARPTIIMEIIWAAINGGNMRLDPRGFIAEKINSLRISLINEELDELKKAISDKNIVEVADALTDILYVAYGAGHAFGIDLDKCFKEVQDSNMSKLGEDGKPIYNEFGKVMKGPKYFKPDLSKFIK